MNGHTLQDDGLYWSIFFTHGFRFHFVDDQKTMNHLTKDCVDIVEMRCLRVCNEELAVKSVSLLDSKTLCQGRAYLLLVFGPLFAIDTMPRLECRKEG